MFTYHLGEPIIERALTQIETLELCGLAYDDRKTPNDYRNATAGSVSASSSDLWFHARRRSPFIRTNRPETYEYWFHARSRDASHLERARATAAIVNSYNRDLLSTIDATTTEDGLADALPTDVVLSRLARDYYAKYYYWRSLLCLASRKCNGTLPKYASSITIDDDTWMFSQAGYVLVSDSGSDFFSPEQICMIADALQSRFQVFVALANGIGRDPETSQQEQEQHIVEQLAWQERVLTKYGNAGYELIKAPEAVYKTRLSTLSGGDCQTPSGETRMIEKYRVKERKLSRFSPMIDDFAVLVANVSTIKTCVELFGLIKLSGHPLIDPRAGGRSYRANAQSRDRSWLSTTRQVEAACQWLVLKGYLAKHGSWPPLKVVPPENSRLRDLYDRRVTRFTLRDFSLSDCGVMRFGKWEEFDYSDDYRSLLDDKSIGGYRSSLPEYFAGSLPPNKRRLLLRMKDRPSFNMREIYRTISTGKIPNEWRLVCLYPKEREFKLAARSFSMLCEEMRSACANNEHNVATILKLIDEQTMTKSRVEEDTFFFRMTAPANNHVMERIYIEIDLSGWNQMWRKFVVESVSRILEDIFGTHNHFSWLHRFFESCLVSLRVSGYEPKKNARGEYDDPDLAWTGHLGGFEGLAQKLWTFITLGVIQVVMAKYDVEFTLAGQGDNQVLSVWWKAGERTADEIASAVLADLEIYFDRINHEVKPEECLVSRTVLTYSKKIWIDGVAYHTELKASSRLFESEVADQPSLTKGCSNVSSGAIMASSLSRNPFAFSTLSALHRAIWMFEATSATGLWPRLRKDVDSNIIALMSLPGALGGVATDLLPSYCLRGQSDMLSSTVGWILRGKQSTNPIATFLLHVVAAIEARDAAVVRRSPSPLALLLDPYSLPLAKPGSLAMQATRSLASSLQGSANRDFADLGAATADRGKLLEALAATRPLYPIIASDIFAASLPGATEKVASLFTNSRSIRSLVSLVDEDDDYDDETRPVDIASAVEYDMRADLDWMTLCREAASRYGTPTITRQYPLCVEMRKHWGVGELVGVTTVSPFDKAIGPLAEGIGASAQGGSTSAIKRGRHRPYLGYATKQKRTDRGFEVQSDSSVTNDLKQLTLIASQIRPDATLMSLLDQIARSKGPYSIEMLLAHLPVVSGGVAAHRHDNIKRAGFYLNVPPEWASNAKVTTDRASKLLADDYPYVPQEHLLVALAFGTTRAVLGTASDVVACFVEVDLTDVSPLPNAPVSLTAPVPRLIKARRDNYLLYAADFRIKEPEIDWPSQWKRVTTEKLAGSSRNGVRLLASFAACILLTSAEGKSSLDAAAIRGFEAEIDMQESRGIGIDRAVDACALAVTLASASVTLEVALREKRSYTAKRSEVILRLSSVIAPFLRRILFDADDSSIQQRWRRNLILAPTEDVRSVNATLIGLVASRAYRTDMLERAIATKWLVPSDFILSTNLFLLSWMKLLLLRQTMLRAAPVRIYRLMREAMYSTETRASNLVASISALAAERDEMLLNYLRVIETSPPISIYAITRADMLRPLREMVRPQVLEHQWTTTIAQARRSRALPSRTAGGVMPEKTLPPLATRQSLSDAIREHARRPAGVISSMTSVALSTLDQSDIQGRRVLIVGSGEGGFATAAALMHASAIEVHDLHTSLPDIEHAYAVFGAPDAEAHGLRTPVTRSIESVGTSGDVYDEGILKLLVAKDYDVVIVDIQPMPRRDWLNVISAFAANTVGKIIYHRTLVTPNELERYAPSIGSALDDAWISSASHGETARSIVSRGISRRVAILEQPPTAFRYPTPLARFSSVDDLAYRVRNVLAICRALVPDADDTLESMSEKVEALAADMLGDRRGAVGYAFRHRLLVLREVVRLLLRIGTLDQEAQLSSLIEWDPRGELAVGRGSWTLSLEDNELRTLQLRIAHCIAG